jgi:hypothetical protein
MAGLGTVRMQEGLPHVFSQYEKGKMVQFLRESPYPKLRKGRYFSSCSLSGIGLVPRSKTWTIISAGGRRERTIIY